MGMVGWYGRDTTEITNRSAPQTLCVGCRPITNAHSHTHTYNETPIGIEHKTWNDVSIVDKVKRFCVFGWLTYVYFLVDFCTVFSGRGFLHV